MTTTQRTARELTPAIGQQVHVAFEQLTVLCTVLDAKNSWGKVRLLVQPVAGRGQQWIELQRLVSPSPAVTDAEYEATVLAALSHFKGVR
jgi:hypothetical protein